MAWGNPVAFVRTLVQQVPVAPVVRPPVVRPMQPPAPHWIYAAPLKQQRSVQSTPGANAVPKVVALKVGTPQAKKDSALIEGRVPTSMWYWNFVELFDWFTLIPLSFSLYLVMLVACIVSM